MTAIATGSVDIRTTTADVVRPLRAAILRPGLGMRRSVYPTDGDPVAGHVAAVRDGRVIGVGSIAPQPMDERPDLQVPATDAGAWRLRGMAVDPSARRLGVGAAVLSRLLDHAGDHGGRIAWANARAAALDFYRANGWTIVSGPFELPDIGTHRVIVHALGNVDDHA